MASNKTDIGYLRGLEVADQVIAGWMHSSKRSGDINDILQAIRADLALKREKNAPKPRRSGREISPRYRGDI